MPAGLIALLVAFALDLALGDPPNALHPVVAMGSFIRRLTRAWNYGSPMERFSAGLSLVVAGGLLFSLPWLALGRLWQGLPAWALGLLEGILLKPMFAFRGLLRAGREVHQALAAGDLAEARRLVAWHLVSRDTRDLSAGQVASATIESLAENLTDSFLAPLLAFALGGLPLAWLYRFVNTADAMIGYHSSEYEYFGKVAARLDDLLNWLPARIAGGLLVLSTGLCRLAMGGAWRTMLAQHDRTGSPNAGWTMAAAAGGLGIVLEKTGHYRLEGGRELPAVEDIRRSGQLLTVALLASVIFCGGLVLGIHSIF